MDDCQAWFKTMDYKRRAKCREWIASVVRFYLLGNTKCNEDEFVYVVTSLKSYKLKVRGTDDDFNKVFKGQEWETLYLDLDIHGNFILIFKQVTNHVHELRVYFPNGEPYPVTETESNFLLSHNSFLFGNEKAYFDAQIEEFVSCDVKTSEITKVGEPSSVEEKQQRVDNVKLEVGEPSFLQREQQRVDNLIENPPWVSNCLFGSKLYINDDIPEIKNFIASLSANEKESTSSDIVVQLSSNTYISNPADSYTRVPLMRFWNLISQFLLVYLLPKSNVSNVKTDGGIWHVAIALWLLQKTQLGL